MDNSYSDPLTITYDVPSASFPSGGTVDIKGQPGYKGRLRNILLKDVSVAFNAVTTSAKVRIGTTAVAAKHHELDCGTTGIGSVVSEAPDNNTEIAADEIVRVTRVANTGGSPAGTAAVQFTIDWYK
jgi:hypothetical protein